MLMFFGSLGVLYGLTDRRLVLPVLPTVVLYLVRSTEMLQASGRNESETGVREDLPRLT